MGPYYFVSYFSILNRSFPASLHPPRLDFLLALSPLCILSAPTNLFLPFLPSSSSLSSHAPVGNLCPATRFRTFAQSWTKINNLWQYTKYRTHQSALTAVSPPDRLVSPLAGKRQNDPRSGHIHDRERAALHPCRESCNRAER